MRLRELSRRETWAYGLLLGAALELLTVALRFGAGLESTRETASTVGALTFGLRVHHGYVGVVALAAGWWLWRRSPRWAGWLLVAGIGLVASDVVHHFVVLWLATGSPQFDLVYPG